MSSPDFLTGPQVCELYQVHRQTLRRWVRAGFFPKPVQIGPRTVRFRRVDIEGVSAPRDRGAVLSGWIAEPPADVDRDKLVNGLPNEAASVEEIAEMRGMKSVAEIAAETGMRSIEEIATASAEKH